MRNDKQFPHICKDCGKEFMGRFDKQFCGKGCMRNYHNYKSTSVKYGVSVGTMGAINELVICVFLMRKGYQVFRNMSVNGDTDIITLKDGEFKKVQVTTGYRKKNGYVSHSKKKKVAKDMIVAIVIGENDIEIENGEL